VGVNIGAKVIVKLGWWHSVSAEATKQSGVRGELGRMIG
jgi:hypothetical protein